MVLALCLASLSASGCVSGAGKVAHARHLHVSDGAGRIHSVTMQHVNTASSSSNIYVLVPILACYCVCTLPQGLYLGGIEAARKAVSAGQAHPSDFK